jgi:hypothetical protein
MFCGVKRRLFEGDEGKDGWMMNGRNDVQQESSPVVHVNYTSYQSEKKGQRQVETDSTSPRVEFTKLVNYLFIIITLLRFLL